MHSGGRAVKKAKSECMGRGLVQQNIANEAHPSVADLRMYVC
jgi:hypothetical protein